MEHITNHMEDILSKVLNWSKEMGERIAEIEKEAKTGEKTSSELSVYLGEIQGIHYALSKLNDLL